jgi:hypothetical protein
MKETGKKWWPTVYECEQCGRRWTEQGKCRFCLRGPISGYYRCYCAEAPLYGHFRCQKCEKGDQK